jgi:hypothetical protein
LEKASAGSAAAAAAEEKAHNIFMHSILNNRLQKAYFAAMDASSSARSRYYRIKVQSDYYSSGEYYFTGLPQPMRTTKTNADGRFSMEVPTNGTLVLAARASREVGKDEERYFWLVKLTMEGKGKKSLILSNDNLSSAGSPDSLIVTTP